ncbi:MAG TPA: hypothetical protein VGR13_07040 [Actinomycetota bacterium]|nr:hypothetical protein [Actinomycetota bacterium]
MLSACGQAQFVPPKPQAVVGNALADGVINLRQAVQDSGCTIVVADARFGTDREELRGVGREFVRSVPKGFRGGYLIRKLPVGMTNVQGASVTWAVIIVALKCPGDQ